MKTTLKFSLTFVLIFFSAMIFAQKDCKVLKPEIADSYTGGCRKGLAHGKGVATGIDRYEGHFKKGLPDGKGTYTWASGEVYTGEWKTGLRNGEGVMTLKINGKEIKKEGIWKDDEYKGRKPEKPKVIQRINVDRYTFRRVGEGNNRVLIDLYQNGMRNNDVDNYMIVSNSGYNTSLDNLKGFESIIFPVTIKVTYVTWNKMHAQKIHVIFEFTIFEPGDWLVEITN